MEKQPKKQKKERAYTQITYFRQYSYPIQKTSKYRKQQISLTNNLNV